MLLGRRHCEPWQRRLRVALWPRRSFGRSLRYIGYRLVRMAGSAHGLALGVAIGVFVATLPIPGAQLVLAAALAWLIGGNVPAALLGTFWANPLTLPVLWLASGWVGQLIVSGDASGFDAADVLNRLSLVATSLFAPGSATLSQAYATLWPVLKPLALGATLIGAVTSVVFYFLTLHLIAGYRAERRGQPDRTSAVDHTAMPALPLSGYSRQS